MHLSPWKFVSSQGRSLADGTEQGRGGAWFFGVQARRRRGLGWGKGRGDRAAPMGALGSRGGGPRRRLHRRRRSVAELRRGGGVPATMGRGGWAWEDQWRSRKLAKGSVWGEEGRRRRLGGGLGGGGGHGVVAPLRVQGEAVGRPGRCTGRGRCYLGDELWRRRGRAEVSRRAAKRRTARLGVFVAVARRRPSSASTPWIATRGEAEQLRSGTGVGLGEPGVGRRPGRAGGAWPATSGRPGRTGEGERIERVERERERNLTKSNLNFSQQFQITLKKF